MAVRGRRVPGNPLASKLRELDIRTRAPRRGSRGAEGAEGATGARGADGADGPTGATGATGPAGAGAKGWTTTVTDAAGVATWTFPWLPLSLPTVAATPQASDAVICTVTSLSIVQVSVTAFTVSGLPVSGVSVHLVAYE